MADITETINDDTVVEVINTEVILDNSEILNVSETVEEVNLNEINVIETVLDNTSTEAIVEVVENVVIIEDFSGGSGGTVLSLSIDQVTPTSSATYLEATLGQDTYRIVSYLPDYPQFDTSLSGVPSSSSVYTTQNDFTLTVNTTSGTFTDLSVIRTNIQVATIDGNTGDFSGSQHASENSYTATAIANGFSEDPTPVSETSNTSGSWSRFVPMYILVGGSSPTTLPSASSGIPFGTFSVSGSVNDVIYLITPQSGFKFNVGPYEIFENQVSTITGQVDTVGTSRDFIVYTMGKIGSSGSATFNLA